jgi:hypothetical protein
VSAEDRTQSLQRVVADCTESLQHRVCFLRMFGCFTHARLFVRFRVQAHCARPLRRRAAALEQLGRLQEALAGVLFVCLLHCSVVDYL